MYSVPSSKNTRVLKNLLSLRERYPDIFVEKHVDPGMRTRILSAHARGVSRARERARCASIDTRLPV